MGVEILKWLVFGLCVMHSATILAISNTGDWVEDIDYFHKELERNHINLYHNVSKEEFTDKLFQLKSDLPSLSENQVMVELMKISRMIGDGHTQLAFWEQDINLYPFQFLEFDGDLRLIATDEPYRQLLGHKLTAINGTPLDVILDRLSPIVQGVENEYSLKIRRAFQINIAQVLEGAGISASTKRAAYTFTDDSGLEETVSVSSLSMGDYHSKITHHLFPKTTPFKSKRVEESSNLWMSADMDTQTAYIYFKKYPSFSNMEKFVRDVEKFLEKNNVKNLIVDLRDNGGGDFFVGLIMAWGLVLVDSIDWDHGVYTLISAKTYSAGMSNAAQYRQILNAKLVGEPTGGNPVGYQDMDQFSLPNSDWVITYSKRNYRFQDTFTEGVQPDVMIKRDWQSYKKGIDRPLEWVLDDIRKRL
ncbi:S41 family peptidase [Microbulbifer variabilis]|uniref:S41 family peptidase n=1 Tax=Microbulbifer variabilis TaxID=266805 RepID=UPI001CFECF73|nr:S41 family peptidase [Microbulbifer variabilis]